MAEISRVDCVKIIVRIEIYYVTHYFVMHMFPREIAIVNTRNGCITDRVAQGDAYADHGFTGSPCQKPSQKMPIELQELVLALRPERLM